MLFWKFSKNTCDGVSLFRKVAGFRLQWAVLINKFYHKCFLWALRKFSEQSQQAITCSKSTIEALQKDVKYVQSQQ